MYSNCGKTCSNNGGKWDLMENKVQWVILKRLLGGDLGVANIYAPNTPKEWCFFWAEMI